MSAVPTTLQSAYNSLSSLPRQAVTYVSSQFPQITALAKSIFSYLSAGVSTFASKSFAWIKVQGSFAAQTAAPYVSSAKMHLSQNKKVVFGGAVVSVMVYALYYFWKNLPQQPIVKMQSTLNISKLSISVPKELRGIPDVTMTFCIDISTSMQNPGHTNAFTRIQDVQNAMEKMLRDAQTRVDEGKALIRMAIVAFNDQPKTLIDPVSLAAQKNTVQKIVNTINGAAPEGGTELFLGLNAALIQLEKMAKSNSKSRHIMVLITDGEDNKILSQIPTIHERLNKSGAEFFAIGVGKDHSRDTLKKITDRTKVKGAYIDTTEGLYTVDAAITKIYVEALSTFNHIELTCPQLKAGTWTVSNNTSKDTDGFSTFDLGTLSEGETRELKIEIKGKKLAGTLDLSTLKFLLTFTDPKGKKGYQYIPWQASTIIDPALL